MARTERRAPARIDTPKGLRSQLAVFEGRDRFGRFTESIARWMGTPWFILGLTFFVIIWMLWNTVAPIATRFDSAAIGFTALTLILSLQASYAAPLILLAQNRQDDRDRVAMEQDRQRAERNLQDTEYLAREIVALRLGIDDLASKDFVRAELKALLAELDRDRIRDREPESDAERAAPSTRSERAPSSPRPERAKRIEGP